MSNVIRYLKINLFIFLFFIVGVFFQLSFIYLKQNTNSSLDNTNIYQFINAVIPNIRPPASIPPVPDLPQRRRTPTPRPTSTPIPQPSLTPTITTTPTPTAIPLPQGKKNFSVSGGNAPGPRLSRGFLDPYDPQIGTNHIVSVNASFSSPIDSINVTMRTDSGSQNYPMTLVEGTNLDGRWETNYLVIDTHNYIYHAVFEATGGSQIKSLDVALR